MAQAVDIHLAGVIWGQCSVPGHLRAKQGSVCQQGSHKACLQDISACKALLLHAFAKLLLGKRHAKETGTGAIPRWNCCSSCERSSEYSPRDLSTAQSLKDPTALRPPPSFCSALTVFQLCQMSNMWSGGAYSLHNIFDCVGQDELIGPMFDETGIFYKSLLLFYYVMLASIVLAVIANSALALLFRYSPRGKLSDADRYSASRTQA